MEQRANILVVDDNKDLLNTLALILKRKGYLVDTAEGSSKAFDKISACHFDLVLVDAGLPRLNIMDAMYKIRESDPELKVILMMSYDDADRFQKVLQEGAYGVLYKPVDVAKLLDLIGVNDLKKLVSRTI